MSLKSLLTDMVQQIPGALGAILVDWEGEAVEHVSHMDDFQLKLLGAHHGIILENLRSAAQRLGAQDVDELVVHAEKISLVIAPVTSEYFLVLTLRRQALTARARAVARSFGAQLLAEIS